MKKFATEMVKDILTMVILTIVYLFISLCAIKIFINSEYLVYIVGIITIIFAILNIIVAVDVRKYYVVV